MNTIKYTVNKISRFSGSLWFIEEKKRFSNLKGRYGKKDFEITYYNFYDKNLTVLQKNFASLGVSKL